ncbi:hypothetical protein MIR68_008508 [Amoeboaphelidium protococcarum]|nr:hypothetical protein MIR68_008508 [Amoeboaphelidium protococcarum]
MTIFKYFIVLLISSVSAYSVKSEQSQYKQTVCASQKGYCTSVCGGEQNTKFNECNVASMKWSCECVNKQMATVQNAADSLFPVQTYQCFGEKSECYSKCRDNPGSSPSVELCQYNECDIKFTCGSAKGGEKTSFRVAGGEANKMDDQSSDAPHQPVNVLQMNSVSLVLFLLYASLL